MSLPTEPHPASVAVPAWRDGSRLIRDVREPLADEPAVRESGVEPLDLQADDAADGIEHAEAARHAMQVFGHDDGKDVPAAAPLTLACILRVPPRGPSSVSRRRRQRGRRVLECVRSSRRRPGKRLVCVMLTKWLSS